MAKLTKVELDTLKGVLDDLNTLQSEMNNSSGAMAHMGDISSISGGLGPLIDGTGATVAQYVDARTNAIRSVFQKSGQGLGTVIGLLSATISNYETNENNHRQAADGTDASGGADTGDGKG